MILLKKYLLTAAAALIPTFSALAGTSTPTALFIYNNGTGTPAAGTYTPGSSFTFAISIQFVPGGSVANLDGLSYWFEQSNPSSPYYFSITNRNVSGSMFTDLQTSSPAYPLVLNPQDSTDLGALLPDGGIGAGTYFIANLTIAISPSATPGTYSIESTTMGGKTSVIISDTFNSFPIPQSVYTITIVPEPGAGTLAVIGSVLVAGLYLLRRRAAAR